MKKVLQGLALVPAWLTVGAWSVLQWLGQLGQPKAYQDPYDAELFGTGQRAKRSRRAQPDTEPFTLEDW